VGLSQFCRVLLHEKICFWVLRHLPVFTYFASAPLVYGQTASSSPTQDPKTIAVSQIHTGMRGTAYTVFEGVKPRHGSGSPGVLHNVNGPKGNIILVRLHGQKVEYTGVVAGMSGSPVYFDGKLAGAIAFRMENSPKNQSQA